MNAERYISLASENHMTFEFESMGPRGKIKKGVRYSFENIDGIGFYNLGFGDVNEETGKLDDLSKSNNGDKDKVLATVASTVLEFTNHFPNAFVYAQGSTPGRTRMYQMAIMLNLESIGEFLNVYGYVDDQWLVFEPNVNYKGFLVFRK